MADRTTRVLLVLITVALWGVLLRPLFTTTPAQAQQPPPPRQAAPVAASSSCPAIFADQKNVFVAAEGYLTVFRRDDFGNISGKIESYRYPAPRNER